MPICIISPTQTRNLTSVRRPQPSPCIPAFTFFCLVVSGAGLRELEDNTTAGEAAVDLRVGIQPVVNTTALLLVEDDLEDLGAVLLGAEALADDLNGVDEVGQDGIVDGGESAGARALLLEGVAGAGRALGARENAASGNEEDVAVRELLLQLAGEALLNLMVLSQKWDWDKDNDGLFAVTKLDLPCKSIISIYSFTKHLTNMTIGDAFTSQALPDTLKLCTISGV
jgi:hypothetical protein